MLRGGRYTGVKRPGGGAGRGPYGECRMIDLIPTKCRVRLPRQLSYPLNATEVTAAVRDTPQLEQLGLSFSDCPTVFASDFQRCLRSGEPYRVLSVQYYNWSLAYWAISVYPVPAAQRSLVNRLLADEGLPWVRQRLKVPRSETWLMQKHRCSILFSVNESCLTFQRFTA